MPPKPSTTSSNGSNEQRSGYRNFANYRIRALLYAGKPNWGLLATVTPH